MNLIVSENVSAVLDGLAASEQHQSNCMFQLALMVARIAVEPCSEVFKEEAAQALMGHVRAKPKSNVVRLFARVPQPSRTQALQRGKADRAVIFRANGDSSTIERWAGVESMQGVSRP